MKRGLAAVVVFSMSGCAGILGIPSDVERAEVDDSGGPDAVTNAIDAEAGSDASDAADAPDTADVVRPCDITKEFATPVPLNSVNTPVDDGAARLSEDEKTIYIDGPHGKTATSYDIAFAQRSALTDSFGPLQSFPSTGNPIDTDDDEYAPNVTDNGLTLVFERKTLATSDSNLYKATRTSVTAPFMMLDSIPNLNTVAYEANPYVRDTSKEIWHSRQAGAGDTDIAVATLDPQTGYVVDPPTGQLEKVNSSFYDASPVISQNGLALYFSSDRPGAGFMGTNIWLATRTVNQGKFNTIVPVKNVSSDGNDYPGFISADGCRLYLASTRAGGKGGQDIYVATRPP